ncbi:MAG TPA: lasso peptide biosynthesis B2 protein [Candidatus Xenobia bacterium]|nr:lasso peptide biosynthesis B2 protein [Candidatus Xenobia bacterium]
MSSWSKLRRLSRDDWGVLARCLWLIPVVELSVRFRAPRHWLPASMDSAPAESAPAGSPSPAAARVTQLVEGVYRRLPFSPTCLTRSLVIYRLLRARGIPCQLRIGLRKSGEALEGHAWTETGRPALDATQFDVLLSF